MKYMADDGSIFNTAEECEAYESHYKDIVCYSCNDTRIPIEMTEEFAEIVTYIDTTKVTRKTAESFFESFEALMRKYADKFGESNMPNFPHERGRIFWNQYEGRWEDFDYCWEAWKQAKNIFGEPENIDYLYED